MRSEGRPLQPPSVRFSVAADDVDASGTIAFAAQARFAEAAEGEFFTARGFAPATWAQHDLRLTRVHASFDFYRPALEGDELSLEVRVGGVGVHSVRLAIAVSRDGDDAPIAEATLVSSCVDSKRRSMPLPLEFAEALRALARS